MTRLDATFQRLRRLRRKALIPFVMGGDPDLETTAQLIRALAESGADVIEIGIPFSDPLADGPIIQRASTRALAHGTTPPQVLQMLRDVSRHVDIPLVVLSYWNPILQFSGALRINREAPAARLRSASFGEASASAPNGGDISPKQESHWSESPAEADEGEIVIVSHGGVIAAWLAEWLNADYDHVMQRLVLDNAGITAVDARTLPPQVLWVNATTHLTSGICAPRTAPDSATAAA